MTFIVGPSRKGSLVSRVYAAMARDAKAAKKTSKQEEKPEVSRPKGQAVEHEGYRRLVASMPCIRCGKQGRSQAAHPPPEGKAIKRDDRECFPLCCDGPGGYKGCHPRFDKYELMPHAAALKQARAWAAQVRAEIIAADEWPKRLKKWDGKP